MTTFEDGPAKGQALALGRAPYFLRVVQAAGADQAWDALDQLDDCPAPGEKLFAYVRIGHAGAMHVLRRGKGVRSGWQTLASYRFIQVQPEDAEMRTTAAWRAWCKQHAPAMAQAPDLSD